MNKPHNRRSPRRKGFDCRIPGFYFFTSVTKFREEILAQVNENELRLTDFGKIVFDAWHDLPNHFPDLTLDQFVVMPNHIHGLVLIQNTPVTEIVRALKSFSARRINELRETVGMPVWQRSFHEYYVYSERRLRTLRQYIHENPANWIRDRYNRVSGIGFKICIRGGSQTLP
jgi:putative transposase